MLAPPANEKVFRYSENENDCEEISGRFILNGP